MMNFNGIFLRNSIQRVWNGSKYIRTIYTAQADSSPLQIYRNKVQAHELRADPRQEHLISLLDKLYYDLQTYEPEVREIETMTLPDKKATMFSKLSQVFKPKQTTKQFVDRPKSLYIYGGAGCGKVFLLVDLDVVRIDIFSPVESSNGCFLRMYADKRETTCSFQ